jgi:magnesium transporter
VAGASQLVPVWHDESVDQHLLALDGSPASADPSTIKGMLADGKLLWLDLDAADEHTIPLLRDVFHVHPLALKAVAEFGQRPKIEMYGDVAYLVMYGARGMGDPPIEVHCFYADSFLITVRRDQSAVLDQLREQTTEQGGPVSGQVSGQRPPRLVMLHHIIESQIDSFFPTLSDFDDKIDDLQQRIFAKPSDEELAELFSLQRWLISLRKLVTPERDMVASLVSGIIDLPGKVPESEPYIRDLYDRLIRISDLVDSYRDLLSNAMDAYLSTVSNRLNQVMKQLTIIATVFLPLSFLTGFFGQNFGWMVSRLGSLPVFLILGFGTELLAVAGLVFLFRRRGWM